MALTKHKENKGTTFIPNPSNSLILEAIQTIPLAVPVVAGRLRFVARGVRLDSPNYLASCQEHGILPYTIFAIVYDFDAKKFVPSRNHRTEFPEGHSTRVMERIPLGGQISLLDVSFGPGESSWCRDGFDLFNERFLNIWRGNGYRPLAGDIWFSSKPSVPSRGNLSRSNEMESGLTFFSAGENTEGKLILHSYGQGTQGHGHERFVLPWFAALRERYANNLTE